MVCVDNDLEGDDYLIQNQNQQYRLSEMVLTI